MLTNEIKQLKNKLKDKVVILGHHYQKDEVIQFADFTGDSLELAKIAAKEDKEYIVFCGVHFMAETADMLSTDNQKVILPDLTAGCTMADMASKDQVEKAWKHISSVTDEKITPITYINCTADLKAFVGKHDGCICTSSNAEEIISWAFEQGEKLLFFPDQHLGKNTAYKLGVALEDMIVYDPMTPNGGVTDEQLQKAKVILWDGYCCVHQNFHPKDMDLIKQDDPEVITIVHPECYFEATQHADKNGSTSYIIKEVEAAPAGSKFAIGTESNLVNRLKNNHKDKTIFSIAKKETLCRTMNQINQEKLYNVLKSIEDGNPINVIKVDPEVTKNSLAALDRMLSL